MHWKIAFLMSIICNIIMFFLLFFKSPFKSQCKDYLKQQKEKEGQDTTVFSHLKDALSLLDKEMAVIISKISNNNFVVSNEFNDLEKEINKIQQDSELELSHCNREIAVKIEEFKKSFQEEKTEFAKIMLKTKFPVLNNVYLTTSLHKLEKSLKEILKLIEASSEG